jgi:hypothetical protein
MLKKNVSLFTPLTLVLISYLKNIVLGVILVSARIHLSFALGADSEDPVQKDCWVLMTGELDRVVKNMSRLVRSWKLFDTHQKAGTLLISWLILIGQ